MNIVAMMTSAILISAATGKMIQQRQFRGTLESIGIRYKLQLPLALGLPSFEFALAVALLTLPSNQIPGMLV